MTTFESKLTVPDDMNSLAPITVAMVYKNDFKEVSYISESNTVADSGFSSIALIFVLSLLALVTISRRPPV